MGLQAESGRWCLRLAHVRLLPLKMAEPCTTNTQRLSHLWRDHPPLTTHFTKFVTEVEWHLATTGAKTVLG